MTAPAAGRPPLCGKPSHRAGGALACPGCLAASVAELQGSRMSLASDDPEHVVVVPGGLLAPTA